MCVPAYRWWIAIVFGVQPSLGTPTDGSRVAPPATPILTDPSLAMGRFNSRYLSGWWTRILLRVVVHPMLAINTSE